MLIGFPPKHATFWQTAVLLLLAASTTSVFGTRRRETIRSVESDGDDMQQLPVVRFVCLVLLAGPIYVACIS